MRIRKTNIFYNGSSQNKIEKLLKLAKTFKYSTPKLAKIFNCDRKTIIRALAYNNIILPNLGKFKRKYHLNDSFFKELNPVSAYWLGFIAADGTLNGKSNSLRIGLNKSDDTHLRKFMEAIDFSGKVYYVKSNNSASIELFSKEVFKTLLSYGVSPNKSLTIKEVKTPDHLMSHFIRGVYDGDGTISGYKRTHLQFMIAGNRPFMEQIQEILIKECNLNKVGIYPLKSKAHRVQYTGIQVFKILNFIYKDSNQDIRLDRKYEKFLDLKKKFKVDIKH